LSDKDIEILASGGKLNFIRVAANQCPSINYFFLNRVSKKHLKVNNL